MSKFGDLIDLEIPVLLDFYSETNDESKAMNPVLSDVAAALGNKAKVVKINVDKNKQLSEALHIKDLPTLVVYKDGEMVWRESGSQDANSLIAILEKHI